MKKVFLSLLLVIALVSSVYGADAKLSAECKNGIFIGVENDGVISWKGVPYAQPPVRELRWKAPKAPQDSSEIISADEFAFMPIQNSTVTQPASFLSQDEDCLYLNVYKADDNSSALRPVMVWIHGGSFRDGGTANSWHDGAKFVAQNPDVIFVSVGYRLGLLGFIDFKNSGLAGADEYPDSGNLGILDIQQAMSWIHDNISAFGGNPENITLFGESSGAASVSLVMALPESAGLFKRAITQSGAVSMTSSIGQSAELTQKLAAKFNASSMSDLTKLTSADLKEATAELAQYFIFPERDGKYFPLSITELYNQFAANSANFELMTGSNKDEINYWLLDFDNDPTQFAGFVSKAYDAFKVGVTAEDPNASILFDGFVNFASKDERGEIGAKTDFLNDLLFRVPQYHQAYLHTGKNYVYFWTYPSNATIGAYHSGELPYIFNIPDLVTTITESEINQELSRTVQDLWVNFAKSGNPSEEWKEFTAENQNINFIVDESVASADLYVRNQYITPLLSAGISGRELINALSGQNNSGSDPDPNPDPQPEDNTISSPVGSKGGGCNTGFAMPFVALLMCFAFKVRA